MRIARVTTEQGFTYLARLDGDTATPIATPIAVADEAPGHDALRDALVAGLDLSQAAAVADALPLESCRLRSPVAAPSKIVAIGLNYADHAREGNFEPPKAPLAFVKTTNSVIGPDDAITYSRDASTQVDYEGELAVVMGRRARRVSEADALSAVLGYTVCNDVSARDAQFADGQWVRGKSFDTFCPLGPWIVSADEVADVQSLSVRTRVNGETLQDGTTKDMLFGVAELVSYYSRFMTLEAGDVIATGTPPGVGYFRKPQVFLEHGDVVEVEVEGIGVLRNPVVVEQG